MNSQSSPATALGSAEATLLQGLWESARAAHVGLNLARQRFDPEVLGRARALAAERGTSQEVELGRWRACGRGADLYLALACDDHLPGAWQRLSQCHLPAVARALSAHGVPASQAEALAEELPGDLVLPARDGRTATRLGTYRGGASLATFLTVAALRRWTNARRARAPESLDARLATRWDGPLEALRPGLQGTGPGPLDEVVGRESAAVIEGALAASWARLTTREALALALKVRDGLSQRGIARLLDVGEPRVSRLLQSAHERLRAEVSKVLGRAALQVPRETWERLGAAVERLLARSLPQAPP